MVEAAGGTVSKFVIELAVNAKRNNLSDDDIIEQLKLHYTSTSKFDGQKERS